MREIAHLRPAQDALLQSTVQDWLNCGRSVELLERGRASEAIRALYAALGRPTPTVLFFSSPALCVLAWRALREMAGVPRDQRFRQDPQLAAQVHAQLRAQLPSQPIPRSWLQLQKHSASSIRRQVESRQRSKRWAHVWDELCAHCEARIDSGLGPLVRERLQSALRDPLWLQLRARLWWPLQWQLEARLGKSRAADGTRPTAPAPGSAATTDEVDADLLEIIREQTRIEDLETGIDMPSLELIPSVLRVDLWAQVGACMGAWWCASAVFYDFCTRIGFSYALEQRRLLRLWLEQCRQSHWWFDCDGIVFVSERPTLLQIDAHGRLHNERGAALEYADGFRLYALQGVRLRETDVLHPERITVNRIETERNWETRRILTSRYGQARYLKDAGATVVHQDARGTLWRKRRAEDTDLVMVEVRNATPEPDGTVRSYLLRVPPGIKSASAAVAWTFGLRCREYCPRIET